jgi:hypothetical protein
MMTKLLITKPEYLAGRLAIKKGEPFRYPSQSFWVQPVKMLDTKADELVADYIEIGDKVSEIPMTPDDIEKLLQQLSEMGVAPESVMANIKTHTIQEAADYINNFLGIKTTVGLDPTVVYDYQSLLASGVCPSCNNKLEWKICPAVTSQDDKFCHADCCGMRYSMVAEKVRVLAVPKKLEDGGGEAMADEEFLRELSEL